MTEKALEAIVAEARARFDIFDALVIHRVGTLAPSDQIVLVAVTSAHRGEAFDACRFLMDLPQDAGAVLEEGSDAAGRALGRRARQRRRGRRRAGVRSPPVARGSRPMPATALIAIDWGTTSARAYRIGPAGECSRDARGAARRAAGAGRTAFPRRWTRCSATGTTSPRRGSPAAWSAAGRAGARRPTSTAPPRLPRWRRESCMRPATHWRSCPACARATRMASPTSCAARKRNSPAPSTTAKAHVLAVLPGHAQQVGAGRARTARRFLDVHDGRVVQRAVEAQHPWPARAAGRRRTRNRLRAWRDARPGSPADSAHDLFGARTLALMGELAAERRRRIGCRACSSAAKCAMLARGRSGRATTARACALIGADALVARYAARAGRRRTSRSNTAPRMPRQWAVAHRAAALS